MKRIDAETARKWRCSPRTSRRWRLAHAPLDDEAAMRAWLCGQQMLPSGTRKLLDTAQRKPAKSRTSTPTSQDTGAAAALTRLETAERDAFARFERATAAGDLFAAKACRGSWLAVASELRRYDESLGQDRREGDVVPRKQAEDAIAAVVWSLHLHIRGSLPEVCITARRASSDGLAIDAGKQIVDRLLGMTAALASDGTFMPALRDAPWAAAAITRGLENRYGDNTADFVRKNTDWLKAMFAYLAEREGEIALAAVEQRAVRGRTGYLTQKDVHGAVLAACPDVPAK